MLSGVEEGSTEEVSSPDRSMRGRRQGGQRSPRSSAGLEGGGGGGGGGGLGGGGGAHSEGDDVSIITDWREGGGEQYTFLTTEAME